MTAELSAGLSAGPFSADVPDDFCRSVEDTDGVLACFNANGVVAVTGVLSKAECDVRITCAFGTCMHA